MDDDIPSLNYRVEQAAEQLVRYSGEPIFAEFADLLETLAELNDNIVHMRDIATCQTGADAIKLYADAIMIKARTLIC